MRNWGFRYTAEDVQFIYDNVSRMTHVRMAELLDRPVNGIRHKVKTLGLQGCSYRAPTKNSVMVPALLERAVAMAVSHNRFEIARVLHVKPKTVYDALARIGVKALSARKPRQTVKQNREAARLRMKALRDRRKAEMLEAAQ